MVRLLVARDERDVLGEMEHGGNGIFAQRIGEDAAGVGERHRAGHELRGENPFHAGRERVYPARAFGQRPRRIEDRAVEAGVEHHLRQWRFAGHEIGIGADVQVAGLGKLVQELQVRGLRIAEYKDARDEHTDSG